MAAKPNVWLMMLVAALLGVLIGMVMNGREVVAQGDGSAAHVVALAGGLKPNSSIQTIYIVDTREQTLLVYEYTIGRGSLDLVAARTFEYDKMLTEFDLSMSKSHRPPKVEEVRKEMKSKKGRKRR